MLWVLLPLVVFLVFFEKWILKDEEFDKIPGPKGIFLFGNSLSFLMDPVKLFYFLRNLSCQYKDIYKLKLGPKKFILLQNPEYIESKVVEECNQIFGSTNRAATMSDLGQMKYLESCIKETLRLYPPVYFIIRKIDEPLKLRNYIIPAGIDCVIIMMDLHRRADQFVEPLKFKPERFLTEPTWHPYAYLPFSAGPRNCIGQKFAMMEMKLALSAALRRYRLLPVTRPLDLVFTTDFILRTTKPILVKIEKRN